MRGRSTHSQKTALLGWKMGSSWSMYSLSSVPTTLPPDTAGSEGVCARFGIRGGLELVEVVGPWGTSFEDCG